jgi:hypothetical protein
VCAGRGVHGVASSRSSACVVEELDVCRRRSAAFPATVDEEPVMGGEVVA